MVDVRQRAAYGQPGATDLTLRLSAEEMAAVGMDGPLLVMWLGTVLDALVAARSGEWAADGDREAVQVDAAQAVSALYHRLRPRLDGVLAAAVRAHRDAGGSIGHLAAAMDTGRSTAQDRRRRLADPPGVWEQWATGTGGLGDEQEDVMGKRHIFSGGNIAINSTVRDQVGGSSVQHTNGRLVINGTARQCPKCKTFDTWDSVEIPADAVWAQCGRCSGVERFWL